MSVKKVKIVEVGPRDGLQNEAKIISVEDRVRFIDLLTQAGHSSIEVGSFVSPKWVPQMANTQEVFNKITKSPNCTYSALVPNRQGLMDAIDAGCKEISVFGAASETFTKKNINCSIAESIQRFSEVTALALKHNIKVRGYLSCVFECPYEGKTSISAVINVAKRLLDIGCYEISLGDTTGVGTPSKALPLIEALSKVIPVKQLAVHFHDTNGLALVNIYAALSLGIEVVDSAAGGLGGCPYAEGASGNVGTEDVVYMLNELGIETGVDLSKVIKATEFICQACGIQPRSKLAQSVLAKKI